MKVLFVWLLCLARPPSAQTLSTDYCQHALGMESSAIPDEHITASSYFDSAVNAFFARAKVEKGGGAWCPRDMVHNEGKEYLEINVASHHVVTSVEVQGRFGNGQGREFAEKYKLQYWRPGLGHWITYKSGDGQEVFEGNTNTYLAKSLQLTPPVIATRIRFIPFSHYPRTVCMRVELYGCPYKGGLVSYSMTDGSTRGTLQGLRDVTYDGVREEGRLSGGLGQLTDGETGHTNFRVDSLGKGKGYEWIGWRNDSMGNKPVEISFVFDSVRNFSSITFYTNNFFTRDTMVFSRARILFSVGGEYFTSVRPIEYIYETDRIFENARNVTIKLNGATARVVLVQLYFALKWIMISEVSFNSVPCNCNATDAIPVPEEKLNVTLGQIPVISSQSSSSSVLLGGLVTLGVICGIIPVVLGIYYKSHKTKSTIKTQNRCLEETDSNRKSIKMKDFHFNFAYKSSIYAKAKGKLYGKHMEEEIGVMYQEPFKTTSPGINLYNQSQLLPAEGSSNSVDDSVDYAVPDLSMTPPPPFSDVYTTPLVPISRPPSKSPAKLLRDSQPPPIPPLPPPPAQQYFSAPKMCQPSNIQGVTGTVIYATASPIERRSISVREVSRDKLRVIEDLGEGLFGIVQLCEIEHNAFPHNSFQKVSANQLVAVRTLKAKATDAAKEDFRREVQILSQLQDTNIVKLLGVAPRNEPLSMLLEYMDYGDLYQFLRRHVSDGITSHFSPVIFGNEIPCLSYGALIYMASQIASGMKYLERYNYIHRDLASRNCLVGHSLTVKISDFGMSRPLYSNDYYRIGGKALLPIRWMAWESVLQGRFTSKSDVWAFGITLWEILTMGRQQPYNDFSDDGVLENVSHCLHDGGLGMLVLPLPPVCPREIYDMMTACWRANEDERPPFWEIHMFLQRKNLPYMLDYET